MQAELEQLGQRGDLVTLGEAEHRLEVPLLDEVAGLHGELLRRAGGLTDGDEALDAGDEAPDAHADQGEHDHLGREAHCAPDMMQIHCDVSSGRS